MILTQPAAESPPVPQPDTVCAIFNALDTDACCVNVLGPSSQLVVRLRLGLVLELPNSHEAATHLARAIIVATDGREHPRRTLQGRFAMGETQTWPIREIEGIGFAPVSSQAR